MKSSLGVLVCFALWSGFGLPGSGCGSNGAERASPVGKVDLALTSRSASGSLYRLRHGTIEIRGPQAATIDPEDNVDAGSIEIELRVGAYEAELHDGWSLERAVDQGGTRFEVVEAELVSLNPLPFTIAEGSTTHVRLRFNAGEAIDFEAGGRAVVEIGVNECLGTAAEGCDPETDGSDATHCTGSGLVYTVPDLCMNDGGLSGFNDNLEVYCVAGRARFCLSEEACPWRSALVDSPETCSRSGLAASYPMYMASAWCELWKGKQYYECNLAGQISFPDHTSGPYPNP